MQNKQTKTIAVLPFVNRSQNKEHEYFSDGMTEEIINALSKIQGLQVTSRSSSFYFKDRKIPLQQIGEQLRVSTVLEGSIRLSQKKMRITAQLVDVADDFQFWSETFDRQLTDIFAVQDEISLLIADRLREHLGHFDLEEKLVEPQDLSVKLYQQYLRSRYHLLKMSSKDIQIGMELLQDILRRKEDFPLGHLGMHMGYTLLGTIGLLPAEETFIKGKAHLDRAVALQPDLAECRLQKAWESLLLDWNLSQAYEHVSRAMEIRPFADVFQTMASILVAEAKFKAAMHYMDTALQMDPFSEINYHLKGFIYYTQEKYTAALEHFEGTFRIKKDSKVSVLYKGQTLILQGRATEALRYFEELPAYQKGDLLQEAGTTMAYAALGQKGKAREGVAILEAALETELKERALNYLILCHTILGEEETALEWIEKGVQMRLPLFVYLYIEPILKPLRKRKRFQSLMQQILGKGTTFKPTQKKYKKALLEPSLLAEYKERLEHLMKTEKPFLDPTLTLRALAEKLGIPPNQLSQLLNAGFDQNFSEYVNSYRLEDFKVKAMNPKLQHLTLLALAFDSGFNSKTVFNTFFKKAMGMTPSAYWKKIVKA